MTIIVTTHAARGLHHILPLVSPKLRSCAGWSVGSKPPAKSTIPAENPPAKSTIALAATPAFTSEGTRKAARGRSRRFCGLREPRGRLYEGTALARLRPRAPRTRPSPDGSHLADHGGVRGGLAGSFGAARAVPHAARPPGIGRGAGAPPADQPEHFRLTPSPATAVLNVSPRSKATCAGNEARWPACHESIVCLGLGVQDSACRGFGVA